MRNVSAPAAALLVLSTSFVPWFRSEYADGDGTSSNSATAWQASTWWSVAVLLCLAAGVLGAGYGRWWRTLAAVLATAGLVVAVAQWRMIPVMNTGGGAWVAADPAEEPREVGAIVHDGLQTVDIDGLRYFVGWGFSAGVAAMLCLALVSWTAVLRPASAAQS
jgi:hypothetical protein